MPSQDLLPSCSVDSNGGAFVVLPLPLWGDQLTRNPFSIGTFRCRVKSDGKPVLNQDLLEALLREQGTRRVIWKHVKAHTSGMDWESVWNRRVDEAARQQAEAQKAARR